MSTTIKILIGVLVATIISVVALSFYDPNIAHPDVTSASTTISIKEDLYKVEISGEVNNPGSYYVKKGTELDDLIKQAEGLTKNADLLCFETTLDLEDNASYYIAPIYELSDVCGNTKIIKYNINTCSAEELEKIDGIGASIAKSIINFRQEIGSFQQLEDIMKVNGIGNSTFSKLKNFIRLKDAI